MCGTHARCQGNVAGVGSGAGRLAPPPRETGRSYKGKRKVEKGAEGGLAEQLLPWCSENVK